MSTYVYGITRAPTTPPDVRGTYGSGVRALSFDGHGAIVEDVDDGVVARAKARVLRAHARVLDAVLEERTVLPLRFGTLVDNDKLVVDRILRPNRETIEALLTRMEDRVELVVRAAYAGDAIIGEIAANDRVVEALRRRVAGVDPAAAYYDRIRLGARIAELLEARRAYDADGLYRYFVELSDDIRLGAPRDPQSVVDGAFLVRRSMVPAFDRRVDEAAQAHPMMRFQYVGPLPPYSFCTLAGRGLRRGSAETPHLPSERPDRRHGLDR